MERLDSSSATKSELLVAAEGCIGYKLTVSRFVKPDLQGKKPYQEPSLRVYGDIRVVTQATDFGPIKDAQAAMKTG